MKPNMKILVTGASGQLGKCIQDSSLCSSHDFIFTDIKAAGDVAALDVTDAAAVERAVKENEVSVIINCVAYTDVEKAESEPQAAEKLNVVAVKNLAAAAASADALLIHFSTDYVFDGTACRPYAEDAVPSPVNVYGRTKLEGENAIISSGCRHLIFRTSWLYSGYGRNFFLKMADLTADTPQLDVVVDQVGTPNRHPRGGSRLRVGSL